MGAVVPHGMPSWLHFGVPLRPLSMAGCIPMVS